MSFARANPFETPVDSSAPAESSNMFETPAPAAAAAPADADANAVFAALNESDGVLGLAVLDEHASALCLQQFDGASRHAEALSALAAFDRPSHVLLAASSSGSQLHELLVAALGAGGTAVAIVPTRSMNGVRGRNLVLKFAIDDADVPAAALEAAGAAIAAAAALLDFVDEARDATRDARSLRVELRADASARKMRIDGATAAALELVANVVDGGKRATLLGLFSTRTPAGERLLRRELLAPPTDAPLIAARSDAVGELLAHTVRYEQLDGLARRFIDLARTLRHFSHSPKSKARATAANEKHIRAIIALKHQVLLFAPLAQLLATCRSPLLQSIGGALSHAAMRELLADVDTVLARDTALSRNAQKMRTEIVFAIQPGVNGLLDVARKSYTETVEDMSALLLTYQARYHLPSLQLQFVVGRGYHLTVPPPAAGHALPADFVQVQRQAKRWRVTTEQLLSLNQRNGESLQEILIITERLLADLVARVGARLAPLLAANDALTQLDMLMAFAALAHKSRTPYAPASVTASLAPLAIKAGRHPVFEQLAAVREHGGFTPNDVIVGADEHNLLVLSGGNMSGKSTLLRQVALIVVLAHVGCFVPAEHCTVRAIERLCVRIGDDGAAKTDASSFYAECRQAAAALQGAGARTLLLVDELGRSTANDVGAALAWSVAEHVALRTRALTIFVTHYTELHRLEQLYAGAVRSMHMQVYQLTHGPNARESYGIDVAAQAGFPAPLLDDARRIRAQLDQHALEAKARTAHLVAARSAADRADDELAKRLLALRHSTLAPAPLRDYLVALAAEFKLVV